ncbi:hypothetical protein [Succinimonas sp.]|uniref:hypothetical protein n=1 Tax=Succinimonas sp. TaxID=1936151 RepID=UPI00386A558B
MQQKKSFFKKTRHSGSDLNAPGNPRELSELERDGGKLGSQLIMLVVWGGFAALLAFVFFFITNTEAGQELEIRRVARAALRMSSFRNLSLESIDQIRCQRHTEPIPIYGGEEFRDDCEAIARYSNGTESRICITKTGTIGTNPEREDKTKIDSLRITVNLCGLDPKAEASRQIYAEHPRPRR